MGYADSEGGASVRSTTSRSGPRKRKDKKTLQNDHHENLIRAVATPVKQSFTTDKLPTCLSQLARTADGIGCAYLKLDVSGHDITSTQVLTSNHKQLQTLVLKDNELTDLTSLTDLQHLTSLDVSGNKLTRILAFAAPGHGSNLRVADLSHNLINMATDITRFSRLTQLNLEHNQMETMAGLGHLPLLSVLRLTGNKLTTLHGLQQIPCLRELHAEDNGIRCLAGISHLTCLEVLHVARNRITDLRALSSMSRLQSLDVSVNCVSSLEALSGLSSANLLAAVHLAGNPVCRVMQSRLHTVYLLPQVSVLDGQQVAAEEKIHAAIMHGLAAGDLRRVRRSFFREGELDDGGGAVPPPEAGLIASAAEEEEADQQGVATAYIRVDALVRQATPSAVLCGLVEDGATTCDELGATSCTHDGISTGQTAAPATDDNSHHVTATSAGVGLIPLANELMKGCEDQLQTAKACFEWVSTHITPPPGGVSAVQCVQSSLFADQHSDMGSDIERLLLRSSHGTWAERAATLFVLLAKACEIESVAIPGYCKTLLDTPGHKLAAHNHMWAGVKVNGKWRLVDPALTAVSRAAGHSAMDAPFYTPPSAWIYTYFPLEYQWQLLPEPMALSAWWALPACSVGFFSRGCKLVEPAQLQAVTVMPPTREGGILPVFELCIAAPASSSTQLRHALHDLASGRVLASWQADSHPEALDRPGYASVGSNDDTGLTYQQVEHGPSCLHGVSYGPVRHVARNHRLVTALPAPGDYVLEVQMVTALPQAMELHVHDLPAPLPLRVADIQTIMKIKVSVPPILPATPSLGLLHSKEVWRRHLPTTSPYFTALSPQVLSPGLGDVLESDRPLDIKIMAPAGCRLTASSGQGTLVELQAVDPTAAAAPASRMTSQHTTPRQSDSDANTSANLQRDSSAAGVRAQDTHAQPAATPQHLHRPMSGKYRPGSASTAPKMALYTGSCTVPRSPHVHIMVQTAVPEHDVCVWQPVLTWKVREETQHIVDSLQRPDVAHVEMDDPQAAAVKDMFMAMDKDRDGVVTRGELLTALRKDRGLAESLQLPTTIKAHDGSCERFIEQFERIAVHKQVSFTFDELCRHLGVKPSDPLSSDEEYDSCSEVEEEGQPQDRTPAGRQQPQSQSQVWAAPGP